MERGGGESVGLVDVNHPSFCENAKKSSWQGWGGLGGGSRGWVGDGVGGCEPRVEGIVKRA